jgi:hypothetical protein
VFRSSETPGGSVSARRFAFECSSLSWDGKKHLVEENNFLYFFYVSPVILVVYLVLERVQLQLLYVCFWCVLKYTILFTIERPQCLPSSVSDCEDSENWPGCFLEGTRKGVLFKWSQIQHEDCSDLSRSCLNPVTFFLRAYHSNSWGIPHHSEFLGSEHGLSVRWKPEATGIRFIRKVSFMTVKWEI